MQFVVHHQASCAALVNVYHPLLTLGCWAGVGCSVAQAEELRTTSAAAVTSFYEELYFHDVDVCPLPRIPALG